MKSWPPPVQGGGHMVRACATKRGEKRARLAPAR